MSDLDAALREAVASVDQDRTHRPAPRPTTTGYVTVLDRPVPVQPLHAPRQRVVTASFWEVVRTQLPGGPAVAVALRVLRELLLFVALFWLAAVLVAFGEDGGAVRVPLVGAVDAITASALGALLLRGVFAGLSAGERYFGQR